MRIMVVLVVGLLIKGCALLLPPSAYALSATCISTPFPTTPLAPNYSINLTPLSTDHATLTLWRQACQDGSGQTAALVRITPTSSGPFICSADFYVIQGGTQRNARISQTPGQSFCASLFVATTFLLVESPGQLAFDASSAFTVVFDGTTITQLDVPSAGPSSAPPVFALIAIGCTTCHSGQTVGYRLDFTNSGPTITAELKGGARFPDGSSLPLLNQVATIPAGASSMTFVPLQTLPGGLPTLDLTIEAAILDPIFGVTLSRQTTTLHLLP